MAGGAARSGIPLRIHNASVLGILGEQTANDGPRYGPKCSANHAAYEEAAGAGLVGILRQSAREFRQQSPATAPSTPTAMAPSLAYVPVEIGRRVSAGLDVCCRGPGALAMRIVPDTSLTGRIGVWAQAAAVVARMKRTDEIWRRCMRLPEAR